MNNVVNLADFRTKRQPTKQDIAEGVAKAFREQLGPVAGAPLQSAIRLIAAQGARAIVKQVRQRGGTIDGFSRFQFFGVKVGGEFSLIGRLNGISHVDDPLLRSEMFLVDPSSLAAISISSDDNIAKSNTFTDLVTLPMSDFYTL